MQVRRPRRQAPVDKTPLQRKPRSHLPSAIARGRWRRKATEGAAAKSDPSTTHRHPGARRDPRLHARQDHSWAPVCPPGDGPDGTESRWTRRALDPGVRRDDVRGWGVVVPKMTFTLALHLTPQPSAPQHQSPITPTTIVPANGRSFQLCQSHPVGSLTTASVLTRCGVGDRWGAWSHVRARRV